MPFFYLQIGHDEIILPFFGAFIQGIFSLMKHHMANTLETLGFKPGNKIVTI